MTQSSGTESKAAYVLNRAEFRIDGPDGWSANAATEFALNVCLELNRLHDSNAALRGQVEEATNAARAMHKVLGLHVDTPCDWETLTKEVGITAQCRTTYFKMVSENGEVARKAQSDLATARREVEGAREALARVRATIKARRDNEYVSGAHASQRPECLGWEAKVAAGKFGQPEMEAHSKADGHFGAHRAMADLLEDFDSSVALTPLAGAGQAGAKCPRCGGTKRVRNGNDDDHDNCPECTGVPPCSPSPAASGTGTSGVGYIGTSGTATAADATCDAVADRGAGYSVVQHPSDGDWIILGTGIRERCAYKEVADWGCSVANVAYAAGKSSTPTPGESLLRAYAECVEPHGDMVSGMLATKHGFNIGTTPIGEWARDLRRRALGLTPPKGGERA